METTGISAKLGRTKRPWAVDCLEDIVPEEEHVGSGQERRASTAARQERGASLWQRRDPGEPVPGNTASRAGFRSDRHKDALRFLPEEAALLEDERPSEVMGGGLPWGKLL